MQRNSNNSRRNPYAQVGVPAYQTPGGKKPSNTRATVRLLLKIAGVLVVIIGLIWGGTLLFSGRSELVRINARPTDNIQAFGENVLYYDGMTLYCVKPNGDVDWHYSLGTGGDFYCTDSAVVAWVGNQIVVMNKSGQPTYADRLEKPILFARVGEVYVAACIGTNALDSSVRILTHTGGTLETIAIPDLYVLDIGFFTSKGQLMWVLSLDVGGNAPITNLATYEPAKASTGAIEMQDVLAYRVYPHNNNLLVADTSNIRTYNYKCVQQTDLGTILVYGWQIEQVRAVNRNTYALLQQTPSTGTAITFSELRLISNYQVSSLRLLTPCFASALSEKGVYAFGTNAVHYAPYGTKTFKTTSLSYALTDFHCILNGQRAVVSIDDSVYIMKLP